MEKVKRFCKELNEKRSYQIVFFVISMCVVFLVYGVLRMKIEAVVSRQYTVVEDKDLIKYIEAVNSEEGMLKISGWCFYKDIDSKNNRVQVFLRNTLDDSDHVWMEVEEKAREDINAYYNCEYDYSNVGFLASAKMKELNIQDKDYEIFIKFTGVKKTINGKKVKYERTVSTNRYIHEGKLTVLEPTKAVMSTMNQELKKLLEGCTLLGYREDEGIYVYQNAGKLFWVFDEKAFLEEDGSTTIQFQLGTTRPDQLPERIIEKGQQVDSLGFVIEQRELQKGRYYPYRVVERNIPTSYPITYFWTGYYVDSKWIWKEYLNLNVLEIEE